MISLFQSSRHLQVQLFSIFKHHIIEVCWAIGWLHLLHAFRSKFNHETQPFHFCFRSEAVFFLKGRPIFFLLVLTRFWIFIFFTKCYMVFKNRLLTFIRRSFRIRRQLTFCIIIAASFFTFYNSRFRLLLLSVRARNFLCPFAFSDKNFDFGIFIYCFRLKCKQAYSEACRQEKQRRTALLRNF